MIDRDKFERIKAKHGQVGSWAVWAQPRPKSRAWVADPDVLDPDKNPALLGMLRSDVVMLGLNQSGFEIERPLSNFHQLNRGRGHDYKIALAFAGTPYWGAYMTDLLVALDRDSSVVARNVSISSALVDQSLPRLREQLDDLGGPPPTLIAFGGLTARLARKYVDPAWYAGPVIEVTHYSAWQFSPTEYRDRVLAEIRA